jgi:hypothetical protein
VDSRDDIAIFIDTCVFARSTYLHGIALFDQSTDRDKQRMSRTAGTLFGDLSLVIKEYVILQVCKMTDPARDVRGTIIIRSRSSWNIMILALTPLLRAG